jgi:hypothetical protein
MKWVLNSLIWVRFVTQKFPGISAKKQVGHKTHPECRFCDPLWPQNGVFWVLNVTHEKLTINL